MMKRAMAILVVWSAAGTALAADEPAKLAPTHANVSYGPYARDVLDFWQASGDGPRPLLVYIHGGGWTGGDKNRTADDIKPYLDKGISYAAINYRLSGEA